MKPLISPRRKQVFGLTALAVVTLAACGGGNGGSAASGQAAPAQTVTVEGTRQILAAGVTASTATVVSLVLVNETRVTRTVYEYTYRITVRNTSQAQTGITATLTSAGAGTTIVNGTVAVGDLGADLSATPPGTITIRQDRTLPFNPDALVWNVQGSFVPGCELDGSAGADPVILPGDPNAPEVATGYASKKVVYSKTYMAVTNNPLSTKVACEVLKNGGTAIDAAVAAQMVLNLVEPQSSGIGGGTFILHYDAATRQVQSYDGREMAPAAATENYLRWKSDADHTTPTPTAIRSGRSIGTPGTLRVLELAHGDHGRKPWKELFEPAIRLATDGFAVPPRMAASISGATTIANIRRDADMAAYFLNPDGTSRRVNSILTNPDLAATFTSIANGGADVFYKDGPLARAIVAKIQTVYDGATTAGVTTVADLAGYVPKRRTPVCTTYRTFEVCGMGPPSSGGIAVAQVLGILENFSMGNYPPSALDDDGGKVNVTGGHLLIEADQLAYADRNKYVADTDFQPLPGGSWDTLINKPYLQQRAGLISMTSRMALPAPAGNLGDIPLGVSDTVEHGTTHLSLADKYGNVVSMTTTIESGLGSYHFLKGFLLNNQLTDFSAAPTDSAGVAIANRVAPLKRPRSSMSPTLVFKRNPDGSRGAFYFTTGSPGGATIIQYVTKTLVAQLDWGLNAQQAVAMVDFGGANANPSVGSEHPSIDASVPTGGIAGDNDPFVRGLRNLGHTVSLGAQSSGLSGITRTPLNGVDTFIGGADPRREGVVLGDTFRPDRRSK